MCTYNALSVLHFFLKTTTTEKGLTSLIIYISRMIIIIRTDYLVESAVFVCLGAFIIIFAYCCCRFYLLLPKSTHAINSRVLTKPYNMHQTPKKSSNNKQSNILWVVFFFLKKEEKIARKANKQPRVVHTYARGVLLSITRHIEQLHNNHLHRQLQLFNQPPSILCVALFRFWSRASLLYYLLYLFGVVALFFWLLFLFYLFYLYFFPMFSHFFLCSATLQMRLLYFFVLRSDYAQSIYVFARSSYKYDVSIWFVFSRLQRHTIIQQQQIV